MPFKAPEEAKHPMSFPAGGFIPASNGNYYIRVFALKYLDAEDVQLAECRFLSALKERILKENSFPFLQAKLAYSIMWAFHHVSQMLSRGSQA